MTATCYRCTTLRTSPSGEPFGACLRCQSFACITCGVRAAGVSRFYCVLCKSGITLLPSGGLPPTGGPGGSDPGGGGPGGAPPAGPGDVVAPYESTAHFEALEPLLAEYTVDERHYYHDQIDRFLEAAAEYAFDEARREEIDRAIGYERPDDLAEQALRGDLRRGAQRLARDVEAAEARGLIRRDLLADAFGVAQWAIGISAGAPVPPERLALLPDERLRFVVGAAAVAAGGVARAGTW